MTCIRLTVLRPLPGKEAKAASLLKEIDGILSGSQGLLLSAVFIQNDAGKAGYIGRVSVWQSREMADREAKSDRLLALRSRIRFCTDAVVMESLVDVISGWLPVGLPAEALAKFAQPGPVSQPVPLS